MGNDTEVSCLLKVMEIFGCQHQMPVIGALCRKTTAIRWNIAQTHTDRHMYTGHRRSAYMSTESPAEGMSPPLYVSLAAAPVPILMPPAVIINIEDDDCASCCCCCAAAGGLQYLYWFFICCEKEPEWLNVLRQCSHRNGFSPLCRRPCSVRWCLCLKALSQIVQTNGRWPVTITTIYIKLYLHFILCVF